MTLIKIRTLSLALALLGGLPGAALAAGADCVKFVDFTCFKGGAKATMVMPAHSNIVNNYGGGAIPEGYTERVLSLRPGLIDWQTFNTLADVARWPVHECSVEDYNRPGSFRVGTCSDGRSWDDVTTRACNGIFEKKLYRSVTTDIECVASSPYDASPILAGCVNTTRYATCAAAGTQFATLVKDATTASVVRRDLTAAQIAAYSTGSNGVSADTATANELCKAYGGTAAYGGTTAGFSSCSNNTLAQFINGTWLRRNACTAGNQRITSLTCGFSS